MASESVCCRVSFLSAGSVTTEWEAATVQRPSHQNRQNTSSSDYVVVLFMLWLQETPGVLFRVGVCVCLCVFTENTEPDESSSQSQPSTRLLMLGKRPPTAGLLPLVNHNAFLSVSTHVEEDATCGSLQGPTKNCLK